MTPPAPSGKAETVEGWTAQIAFAELLVSLYLNVTDDESTVASADKLTSVEMVELSIRTGFAGLEFVGRGLPVFPAYEPQEDSERAMAKATIDGRNQRLRDERRLNEETIIYNFLVWEAPSLH